MCEENSKIRFCTCSKKEEINTGFADEVEKLYRLKKNESFFTILNDDGSYNETYFKWTLFSFQGKARENSVIGVMFYPEKRVNEELTRENILKALNSDNCFDFSYHPQEKDFIRIEEKYKFIELDDYPRPKITEYISFMFENGKWEFGRYPMHYIHKEIGIGKVKTSSHSKNDE